MITQQKMTFHVRSNFLLALLLGIIWSSPLHAQSSAEAGDTLVLAQNLTGKVVRIPAGEMIVVKGHNSLPPIRGRLVRASDSVTLNLSKGQGRRTIPVSEISEISHPRPWLTVLVVFFLLITALAIAWTGFGIATIATVIALYPSYYIWDLVITVATIIISAGLALLFNRLRRRPYSLKKWHLPKVTRPAP